MKQTIPRTRRDTLHTPLENPLLDHLLAHHLNSPSEQLTPSSGFVLSVMDAIHAEAVQPPPIAFPWRRVLPGAIAALGILLAYALFVFTGHVSGKPSAASPLHLEAALFPLTPLEMAAGWTVLAAFLSLILVAASFRLGGRSR
jgi:hypothetical protein